MKFILPQLSRAEIRLQAKYVLAQFPKGCLSLSESDIIRSLPNGEVLLPLNEIVPQLRPEFLAAPEQIQQPTLDEIPDPFHEIVRAQPIEREVTGPVPRKEPAPQKVAPSERAAPRERPEKPVPVSYYDALREENPLSFPLESVVALLPEGSFRAPLEELKRHLRQETVKLPRSLVMRQLKEGRVVVPVEILTAQFLPHHFLISIEQIKARLAEGVVELPLKEIVGQVLDEIAQPLETQKSQPECEEISTPFHEIPQQIAAEMARLSPEVAVEPVPSETTTFGSPIAAQAQAALEEGAEQSPPAQLVAEKEQPPIPAEGTILDTLLQKCRGLGFSGHESFVAEAYQAVVLSPSSLDRRAAACGMMEIMGQMRTFCDEYKLGKPLKLVISSSGGAAVARQLPPEKPASLIILAGFNPSGAGFMSLLLDMFHDQLSQLSPATGAGLPVQPASPTLGFNPKKVPLAPPALADEASRQLLPVLEEAGIKNYLSSQTPGGQKLVVFWGDEPYRDLMLRDGILDIESPSRYCSSIGLGEFESLLLVAQDAKLTLNRSSIDPSLHLLCFFSGAYAEGLLKAKARKALKLLER